MWVINKILIGIFFGYLACATGKWLIIRLIITPKLNKKFDAHLRRRIERCQSIEELWSVESVLLKEGLIDG